jgi:hypothetical protein
MFVVADLRGESWRILRSVLPPYVGDYVYGIEDDDEHDTDDGTGA